MIYVPTGTYLLTSSVQLYLNTFLIGNPLERPVITTSSNFSDSFLIYGKDPSFGATTNFYIGIKNLVFDSTATDPSTDLTLLDWSVSQATQLTNLLFAMPKGSMHVGLSMPEGGSGTMIGDLAFTGGRYGMMVNNQQWLFKTLTFTDCEAGIFITHAFDLVLQNLAFTGCQIAINGKLLSLSFCHHRVMM